MRVVLYELLNNFNLKYSAPKLREWGKRLYALGTKMEGVQVNEDRLVPSLRRLTWAEETPNIEHADFIAPNATILGNVRMGMHSSVWYGATLIGTQFIAIGHNTVVQDRVHISKCTEVGNDVFIGPNCTLQGATIESRGFVSMGATVKRAVVRSGGFVAAGAVIHDNAEVKDGEIWAGSPGRFLRKVTALEREVLREHLEEMQELALIHAEESQKSVKEIICGPHHIEQGGDLEEFLQNMDSYILNENEDDGEFAQMRISMKNTIIYPEVGMDYQPYRFEFTDFPDQYRVGIHQEEIAKVEKKVKAKMSFERDIDPWKSNI